MILRYEISVDDLAGGKPDNWREIKGVVDGQINDACSVLETSLRQFAPELHVSAEDLSDIPEGAE